MVDRTKIYKGARSNLEEKECLICFSKFKPKSNSHKVCNDYCRNALKIIMGNIYIKTPKKEKEYINCKYCGKKIIKKRFDTIICKSDKCSKKRAAQFQRDRRKDAWKENKEKKRKIIYRGYKDPLIPLQKPYYGYEGVVLEDKDSGEIQCHICGKWFKHLGNHIQQHKDEIPITNDNTENQLGASYKDKFGLMRGTALCSMQLREHFVRRAMTYPWERMRKQGKKLTKMSKEPGRIKRFNNHGSAEKKNQNGTCYLQLLHSVRKQAIKLGRTPQAHELIKDDGANIRPTIVKTFGSVADAMKLCKLIPNGNNRHYAYNELTEEFLVECLRNFVKNNKRRPTVGDCGTELLPGINNFNKMFGDFKKAKEVALYKK